MIKLKAKARKQELVYTSPDGESGCKLYIQQKYFEEFDLTNIRKAVAKDVETMGEDTFALTCLRQSIIGWEGITDEEGKELPFNEENQKHVFYDFVLPNSELLEKLSQAFIDSKK